MLNCVYSSPYDAAMHQIVRAGDAGTIWAAILTADAMRGEFFASGR